MMTWGHWNDGSAVLSQSQPLLPAAGLQTLDQALGWAWVVAFLAWWLLQRLAPRLPAPVRWALVGLLALWVAWPGPQGLRFWLVLGAQSPSLLSQLLCAWGLWHAVRGGSPARGLAFGWALAGVLLGWVLLADSFALLPWTLYAWGFSPLAVGGVLGLALLPWLCTGRLARGAGLVVACLLLFSATRLPSGNLWDALLDPLLWLLLHLLAWQMRPRRSHSAI